MQIGILDWIIVGLYLLTLGVVGIVATLRVKDTSGYFLGKRKFGKLLMIAQTFGVGTHADQPVSLTGAVYSTGISAVWYQWKNLFAMPFYWLMAPIFRRVRRTTAAEMVEDRYGPAMAVIYVIFAFSFFTINIASVLKGGAKILNEVLGGNLGVDRIVVGLAVIFILYSFTGGMVASVWTNFVQGLLIIVLSTMLIPLGWRLVGGFAGMRQTLPAVDFSMATPERIGPWFIAMLTINGIIGIMAQPHMIASVGTGKDEHTCRVGFLNGMVIKRLCTIGWAVVGLMAAAMVGRSLFGVNALRDPEEAFGFACRHLLTPGFHGLLLASVMGASLAACSALMIDSGALLTEGFYRTRLMPGRSDSHYLWVGRFSGLAAVVIALVYAVCFIQKVLYSFLLTETMATYMGISIIIGFFWRRANRWGAAASLIVSLITNFMMYHLKHERLDSWDPNIFLTALVAGILSLVIISLLTPPEPEKQSAVFFARLETPSDIGIKVAGEGGSPETAPRKVAPGETDPAADPNRWAAERGRQLLLVHLLHPLRGACGIGFFKAYREDLLGLLMGAGLSVGVVACLWLILHL